MPVANTPAEIGVGGLTDARPKKNVVFAAFAGWDAAGAKSFGYPTFWVNRANQPTEQLGVAPDATSPALAGLLEFVLPRSTDRSSRLRN